MRILLLGVLLLAAAGCGRGYESENRAIVDELPSIDGIELLEEEFYGYCSSDSCPLGNDRSGALLMYTVDVERFTMESLAEAYRDELSGWAASIDELCLEGDSSGCEEIVVADFVRNGAEISLNLDNWPAGRFEVHVDAQGNS